MPARLPVRSLVVAPLDLALHVPFGIAGGAQDAVRNVLVTIELEDGTRGYGEAAPLPAYNGETQEQAIAVLRSACDWVAGVDPEDWQAAAAVFRQRGGAACGSAQAAFEMALLDALTRSRGEPLWRFFGGAQTELETDMTVTTGTPEQARADAQDIVRRGIRMIKVKVGGKSGAAADLARVEAIREVAPQAPLILDGNAALSRSEAAELARGLKERGIVPALLEQWLPKTDLAGMRALGLDTGWTVAADESACTAGDIARIAEEQAAQVINVKLMKAGVAEGLAIVRAAKAAGLGLMIGGNVESILAMSFSACFAGGLGGFAYADLDTPLFFAESPFSGGMRYEGGRILLDRIDAGHGVVPEVRLGGKSSN
jgi:L-Ala-D/L-Glu epimerase